MKVCNSLSISGLYIYVYKKSKDKTLCWIIHEKRNVKICDTYVPKKIKQTYFACFVFRVDAQYKTQGCTSGLSEILANSRCYQGK